MGMNFIFYLLAQTTQPAVDIVRVLEDSQKFYNDAWTSLLLAVGLAVAIVGIAIPYYLSHQQEKTFEKTEKALLEKIENQQTQIDDQIKRSENLQLGLIHFSSAIGLHDMVENVGTKEEIEKNIRVNIDRVKDFYNASEKYKEAYKLAQYSFIFNNQKTTEDMAIECLRRAKKWFGYYESGNYKCMSFSCDTTKFRKFKHDIDGLEKKIDEIKFMRMNSVGQTTGG